YPCLVCPKTFATANRLMSHARTHTRVKSHACPFCSLLFYTRQDVDRHCYTHTKERRFACRCGKKFAREDALKRHVKAKGCG
ncbi:A designed zinc finger protein bound To Dna, partial [Chytridium lagenaria]